MLSNHIEVVNARSGFHLEMPSVVNTVNPVLISPIVHGTLADPFSSCPTISSSLSHSIYIPALLHPHLRSKTHWNNSSRRTRRKKTNSKSSKKSSISRSVFERDGSLRGEDHRRGGFGELTLFLSPSCFRLDVVDTLNLTFRGLFTLRLPGRTTTIDRMPVDRDDPISGQLALRRRN